jgi:hypothetical protein
LQSPALPLGYHAPKKIRPRIIVKITVGARVYSIRSKTKSRAFHLSGLRGGVASGMLALSLVGSLGAPTFTTLPPRSGAFSTDCGRLRS